MDDGAIYPRNESDGNILKYLDFWKEESSREPPVPVKKIAVEKG